jgi:redox-sensing transcriptional repressor
VPAGVDVRKVDLSIELQILAFHAQRRAIVGVAHLGEGEWPDGQAERRGDDGEAAASPAGRPRGTQRLADDTGVAAQAVGT